MIHIPISTDEAESRPILIHIRSLSRDVLIEGDRIVYSVFFHCCPHILMVLLIDKLRSMQTEYNQSLIPVFIVLSIHIRSGTLTVDTAQYLDLGQYCLTLEFCECERIWIDLARESTKLWGRKWCVDCERYFYKYLLSSKTLAPSSGYNLHSHWFF